MACRQFGRSLEVGWRKRERQSQRDTVKPMSAMYSIQRAMDDSLNDIQSAATEGRLGLTYRSACCE